MTPLEFWGTLLLGAFIASPFMYMLGAQMTNWKHEQEQEEAARIEVDTALLLNEIIRSAKE